MKYLSSDFLKNGHHDFFKSIVPNYKDILEQFVRFDDSLEIGCKKNIDIKLSLGQVLFRLEKMEKNNGEVMAVSTRLRNYSYKNSQDTNYYKVITIAYYFVSSKLYIENEQDFRNIIDITKIFLQKLLKPYKNDNDIVKASEELVYLSGKVLAKGVLKEDGDVLCNEFYEYKEGNGNNGGKTYSTGIGGEDVFSLPLTPYERRTMVVKTDNNYKTQNTLENKIENKQCGKYKLGQRYQVRITNPRNGSKLGFLKNRIVEGIWIKLEDAYALRLDNKYKEEIENKSEMEIAIGVIALESEIQYIKAIG